MKKKEKNGCWSEFVKKKERKKKKEEENMKSKKAVELSESVKKKGEKKKEKKSKDVTSLTVGSSSMCLFTKMPWKFYLHNSKTLKMYFQFS